MNDVVLTSKECHCRVCVGDHAGYGPCTKLEPVTSNAKLYCEKSRTGWHDPNAKGECVFCGAYPVMTAREADAEMERLRGSHETFERRLAEACERMRRAAAIVAIGGDQTMATAIYDHSRRLLGDIKPWWESENAQKALEEQK